MFVRPAATAEKNPVAVADALQEQLGDDLELVLFFVSDSHDIDAITTELDARYPDAVTAGCTTMGEVGPLGCQTGTVSALGIASPMHAVAALLEDLPSLLFEDGVELVRRLERRLGSGPLDPDKHVFLVITDGLCAKGELLTAAIDLAADGIPIVGGSAGDGFSFEQTVVALNGQACPSSAVVLLLEPGVDFRVFQVHHFEPANERLVVTSATPEQRLVNEFNGQNALRFVADWYDTTEQDIRDNLMALSSAKPLVFGFSVGGQRFLRSSVEARGDSLVMRGSLEEGTVVRPMLAKDLLEDTRAGVNREIEALGSEPAGAILFNCGGRLLEATSHGSVGEMYETMAQGLPAAGFTTYGEHFGPLLLNNTLTGMLLGKPDGE